jgi:hypothetical protein
MKVSTEIDNNFGYEKITQLVDNDPLNKIPFLLYEQLFIYVVYMLQFCTSYNMYKKTVHVITWTIKKYGYLWSAKRNRNETKRNETKSTKMTRSETKSTKTKRNETKSTKWKRNKTKPTKAKRNRLIWRKWKEKNKRQNEIKKKKEKIIQFFKYSNFD